MSIKTLEERIVNLKKVSAGVETTEQAELRQLDMRGEDPYRIMVVLAKEFGVQITMDWDSSAFIPDTVKSNVENTDTGFPAISLLVELTVNRTLL